MYTLAFDTTANSVSIALLDDSDVVVQDNQIMERGQGEALIPMIQQIMASSGRKMSDIDRIAVSVGPGSFTGVRVGLATARGMGLALKKEVVGITTLEASAYQTKGRVLSVLDTKRGDFYTQIFENGIALEEPKIRTIDEIKELGSLFLTGSGSDLLTEIGLPVVQNNMSVAVSIGLLSATIQRPAEPVYLREADVSC